MTTTKLVGLALAAVVLSGCATPLTPGPRACSLVTTKADCPGTLTKSPEFLCKKGSNCDTAVDVVWHGNACQVAVGAETIRMEKKNNGAFLHWFLPTGSNWEFREEETLFALPIQFDQNAPELKTQFSQRMVTANGRGVQIKNMNTNGQKYDYQLRVFKKGGGANDCIDSTDPAIQNDP